MMILEHPLDIIVELGKSWLRPVRKHFARYCDHLKGFRSFVGCCYTGSNSLGIEARHRQIFFGTFQIISSLSQTGNDTKDELTSVNWRG